ncbi:MAG: hypothetical protein V4490_03315, partial [Pseudomonadota bacterium]
MKKPLVLGFLSVMAVTLPGCAKDTKFAAKPRDPTTISYLYKSLDDGIDAAYAQKPHELVVSDAVSQALMRGDLSHGGKPEEPRFDLQVKDAPAQAFFTGLVKGTPYNIIVHPD